MWRQLYWSEHILTLNWRSWFGKTDIFSFGILLFEFDILPFSSSLWKSEFITRIFLWKFYWTVAVHCFIIRFWSPYSVFLMFCSNWVFLFFLCRTPFVFFIFFDWLSSLWNWSSKRVIRRNTWVWCTCRRFVFVFSLTKKTSKAFVKIIAASIYCL